MVLGGSWGVTLALAYAQAYPLQVMGLILRGVCLLRQEEIAWFYDQVGLVVLVEFCFICSLRSVVAAESASP